MSKTTWFSKIQAGIDVLKTGSEISSPEKWKAGKQLLGNLVVFLSACVILMNQFDCAFCNINVPEETLVDISSGILGAYALIANIITAITSRRATVNIVENVKILSNKSTVPQYVYTEKWDGETERRKTDDVDSVEKRETN